MRWLHVLWLTLVLLVGACGQAAGGTAGQGAAQATTAPGAAAGSQPTSLRLGYFPNVTHATALVGVANGTFQKAIGPIKLETKTFNAGPALIEALFGGQIDIGYVGPNPAINGYIKSKGAAIRVIAGAASGGASFIVRPGANIATAADLAGKKLATPQLGGTQDVALRYYLENNGLKTTDKGGNVQIVPTANPDILTLFKQGQIDGAWVPEPWASRLLLEGNGKLFLDERDQWPDKAFVTTTVIVSKKFLAEHPDVVTAFLRAHVEATDYIKANLAAAKPIVNKEIERITTAPLSAAVLDRSFTTTDMTYDPLSATFLKTADSAFALGFLGDAEPDLKGLFDFGPLNTVLKEKGRAVIAAP